MVTTKCDYPWMILSVDRNWNERLAGESIVAKWRKSRSVKELLVPAFDLLDGELVVVGSDWDVTAIYNFESRLEWVDLEGNIVPSIQCQSAGSGTNTSRPEPGTRAVGRPGILCRPPE